MTTGGTDVVATAARQGALGLVGAVLAGVGGLALTVVVSRMTSPDQAGIYFTMVAAFTIASTVLLLGADTGLVRALAGARAAGDQHLVRAYLRIAARPVAVAAASVTFLVVVAAVVLAAGHDPGHERDLIIAAGILAPFLIPATMSTLLLNGASRGLGSMRTFTTVQQIMLPVSRPILVAGCLAATGAWVGARTASTAVLAWAVPVAIAAVLAARAVARMLPPIAGARPDHVPADLGRTFWRATLPRGIAATFEILIVWSDVILVAWLIGPAAAGIYAAASRFVTTGTFALQAVRLSVGPLLAGAFARADTDQAAQVHRLSIRWAILSTWPVYLAMATFAPGVLSLLGTHYAAAVPALTVLCLAMLVVVATGNANTVLNMGHRSPWAAANTAFAMVVMLAIDLLLVPRIGIVGAAIGWACAMITDAVLGAVEVRCGLGLRSADASVLGAAAVVLAGFGLPVLTLRIAAASLAPSAPEVLVLVAGTAGGALVYAATLYLLRDRLALVEVVGALRRPRAGAGPPTRRDPNHRGGQ